MRKVLFFFCMISFLHTGCKKDDLMPVDINTIDGDYFGEYLIPNENRGGDVEIVVVNEPSSEEETLRRISLTFVDTGQESDFFCVAEASGEEILLDVLPDPSFDFGFTGVKFQDSLILRFTANNEQIIFRAAKSS